jgi:hypothetical protein
LLILGDKYHLTNEDYKSLQKYFKSIHSINTTLGNQNIIKELKEFTTKEKVSYIILNLDSTVSLEVEGYLENLNYYGVEILTFLEFSSKFLDKKDIKLNKENQKVIIDIKNNNKKSILKRLFDFIFSFFRHYFT